MDMNQYLDIFIEESKEHLQSMNQILLQMENDTEEISKLNEIFRIAHTLKGMSSTMGYNNLAQLTHEMESALHLVRSGELKMSSGIIDLLFLCFDELDKYITEIEGSGTEGENTSQEIVKKLEDLRLNGINERTVETKYSIENNKLGIELNEYVHSVIKKALQQELNAYFVKITLDSKCMLKSARAYIIINSLEKLTEIVHSNPSIEDIEDERFDLSFELIVITKSDNKILERELKSISEIENIEITSLEENYSIKNVENNDISINDSLEDDGVTENVIASKSDEGKSKKAKTGKTVRVDIDRLDNLMNLVSELIIIKTRLEDIDDSGNGQSMHEAIEYLERITTSLHDAVMKVRMVPIERVFNRFPRMVRDLAKDLGKEISLIMSGEETEVDRTVIDEIGDPLIHLIRNSIDHGVEEPEVRLMAGKPKNGTVKLIAYPDGNSVVIEVEDDGKGIDIEKVKAKGIERGLITLQQSQIMDDSEAINLLFNPGFSTVNKITDISGRGVGLDVVKTKIESLGGVVEVDNRKGEGTKFIIRLPLTLAIIQALLINVGPEKYAIPLNTIKEITTISADTIRKVQNNEVVLYRNNTLPILRLSNLLQVDANHQDSDDYIVVIVKKGEKTAGIIVDHLIGQQEIVIKSLGKYLSNVKAIAGATILGNGSVALIVDTNSFFRG
ncbi:chemotaxis protein CheA [Alkaliphilus peptidifermentans]|uniref:Chemotaxis protein CheA n=1 Tax=Alkaliphilus peptidifermentans DSM 18978 TaxID=1120976 RepID=A0A1G5DEY9_9FIRM|nr:chemotaxis protein CheA [Alkaliphilus peptidifermentans]SCY13439.1 two-component system, chemotaxis family, sensor kinase CheA [Alkaliphilus peptidifermentans DSM 18978]